MCAYKKISYPGNCQSQKFQEILNSIKELRVSLATDQKKKAKVKIRFGVFIVLIVRKLQIHLIFGGNKNLKREKQSF
jgi:hypothetical protein